MLRELTDRVKPWCLLVLLVSGCSHSRPVPAVNDPWLVHARGYIETESRLDKESVRRRRAAERALIRDPLPDRAILEQLVMTSEPATRHAVIVSLMVHGSADERLAQAILRKWSELSRAEKVDAVAAIAENDLQRVVSLQDQAFPLFLGEHDPRVQLVILGAVRDDWPVEKMKPLLTEYAEHGGDTVRITAYATAVKLGAGTAENLKRELRERGATQALKVIERWEKEAKVPCPDVGGDP